MTYDFDTIVDRRGTNALKWDIAPGELPMWVADMDFAVAPAILEAVSAKARTGVFGYGIVPPEFAEAIVGWWGTRYGWAIDPGWIHFVDGIVPAISSMIRTLSSPGDGVLVQSPVYNCFYSSIRNSGRVVVTNDLPYDGRTYGIDWADLEAKLADPRTALFLLCNPQNPTGQLWSPEELTRMGDLAAAHDVVVISDEIHCDITEPGRSYTPYGRVAPDPRWIALVSPTKSFNIPGLQTAALIAADPVLRERSVAGLNRDEIAEPGAFAVEAAIAAYTQGAGWLDELRTYVWGNLARLRTVLGEAVPQLHVVPGQATYLAWVDVSAVASDGTALADFLRERTGLVVNPGAMYGDNGRTFLRVNLACPRALLDDGLDRLVRGVGTWVAEHPALA